MPPDIFTEEEMAGLRSEAQKWFTDTCDIQRKTRVPDAIGGEDETEAITASNVGCDIIPAAQTLRAAEVIGERLEVRETYTVSLPPGTDVRVSDRLFITSWSPARSMVVQTVMQPVSIEVEMQVIASLEGENSA